MKKKGFLSGLMSGRSNEESISRNGKPSIDYPQAGEKVHTGHYAVRISGCDAECQVSVDGGDWQDCRSDAGYCWYDWDAQPGAHRITARTRVLSKWVKTETSCDVE